MLRRFTDFILFGSIFIAMCSVAMCIETNLLLHLPLNSITFYCFVFGATIAQYNVHYLVKTKAKKDSERLAWSQRNKKVHKILIVTGVALIVTGLLSFHLHHFIFLVVMGGIAFLYSLPVLPFKEKKRLKDFGLLKIVTISLLWTLVTVWFPVDEIHFTGFSFQLVFLRRFIFIFILCLLFDVRDKEIDGQEKIRTVPVIIGINRSYQLSYILLVVFIILSVFQFIRIHELVQFNAMLISAAATAFMIHFTKRNSSDFVFLACIDGMMLLQAMLVIIGSR